MVAVIKTGHSLSRILNYNENKVKEGVAELISAAGYPMDVEALSFTNKLNRLKNQADLNKNVSRNSVHISLNFPPSEKLPKEKLEEIANTYMQKIGFGEQPYLVYQHFDAGHPHIHIVSLKIRADGSSIDLYNIGRNQSEAARKEIEQTFNLMKAQDSKLSAQLTALNPINVQKAQYGKVETKKSISSILEVVTKDYKYTSLPELNAVLKQYNVLADKGSANSRIFQHHGLMYHMLDEKGNKVGVPIKASDFNNKPTLSFLEGRFSRNEIARQPHKARTKNAIDLALIKNPGSSLEGLMKALEKEGIHLGVRKNEQNIIYGITYVDHRTKCVFNGSALGKDYSAKAILERCDQAKETVPQQKQVFLKTPSPEHHTSHSTNTHRSDLLETLLQPEYDANYLPAQLRKKVKKKRQSPFMNG